MNLSLSNKNAFVCGSTQGIGKAVALELAALGANITLMARNRERLATVAKELDKSKGQQHDFVVADFAQAHVLKSIVQAYLSDGKTIHILVNNTGGPPAGPIVEATEEAFLKAYQMHLLASHLLAQAVIPGMKEAGYGRMLQIISTSVKEPIPGLGVSNTTRGAVASWAKTMAGELGPYGITVNNVLPGFTETERLSSIVQNRARKSGKSEEAVIEAFKAGVPARRFASPAEVANVVAFLASPAAAYVNGVSLAVDGGRTNCI